MAGFETKEQVIEVFNKFWPLCLTETETMEKLAKSQIVVRFDITEPEISITFNFRDPTSDGAPASLAFDSDDEPEIAVWSKSEITNKFWQGKLNATIAMARGQVKMTGSISKALGLLSKIKPLYQHWPTALKEVGLENMIL
ncbi:MAG: SCP2 sterol-binding domain-containing protein [Candidatus Thorarchaeota archaeon]|jgi:hypothetical protein